MTTTEFYDLMAGDEEASSYVISSLNNERTNAMWLFPFINVMMIDPAHDGDNFHHAPKQWQIG